MEKSRWQKRSSLRPVINTRIFCRAKLEPRQGHSVYTDIDLSNFQQSFVWFKYKLVCLTNFLVRNPVPSSLD